MPETTIVDSHHHLWKYDHVDYSWIDPTSTLADDYLGERLRAECAANGVSGTVVVQARQTVAESQWLVQLARSEPLIRGVVGWVPLAAADVAESLETLAKHRVFKGVRHVVQDEGDERFLLGADFNRGVARLKSLGLVYDLLIFAHQLPAAIEFVDLHPEQQFVLDHIGKPTIETGEFDRVWVVRIRELAKRDNVVCKFSGVTTEIREATWDVDDVRPYWDTVLEAFQPHRLMFGSDWPVCRLKTEYSRWLATVQSLSAELTASERAALFHKTAVAVYRLSG